MNRPRTDGALAPGSDRSLTQSLGKCAIAASAASILLAGCDKPAPVVVQPSPPPAVVVAPQSTPAQVEDAKAAADKAAEAAKDASRAANTSKDAAMDAKDAANKATSTQKN